MTTLMYKNRVIDLDLNDRNDIIEKLEYKYAVGEKVHISEGDRWVVIDNLHWMVTGSYSQAIIPAYKADDGNAYAEEMLVSEKEMKEKSDFIARLKNKAIEIDDEDISKAVKSYIEEHE